MKPVYKKWIDAMADDIGWKTTEDAVDWGENVNCIVEELGYVVDETNNYLLLASKVNGDMVSGLMVVPKKYIIETIDLKIK